MTTRELYTLAADKLIALSNVKPEDLADGIQSMGPSDFLSDCDNSDAELIGVIRFMDWILTTDAFNRGFRKDHLKRKTKK